MSPVFAAVFAVFSCRFSLHLTRVLVCVLLLSFWVLFLFSLPASCLWFGFSLVFQLACVDSACRPFFEPHVTFVVLMNNKLLGLSCSWHSWVSCCSTWTSNLLYHVNVSDWTLLTLDSSPPTAFSWCYSFENMFMSLTMDLCSNPPSQSLFLCFVLVYRCCFCLCVVTYPLFISLQGSVCSVDGPDARFPGIPGWVATQQLWPPPPGASFSS